MPAASTTLSDTSAVAPRGWHRPVRPVALVLVGGTVLLVWLTLMMASVWYFYAHWEARMTMRNQAVRLRLPEGMQAVAAVHSPLRSRIDMQPLVRVPIHQVMPARISDQLQARVQLRSAIPIDTSVTVDHLVQVKTTVDLSVSVFSWLPRVPVSLPVTVDLPVRMVVPIKKDIPIDLDLTVSGNLPPQLNIPIDAMFAVRPRIKGDIEARMVSETAFKLVTPLTPFPLTIEQANLRVPFDLTFLRQRGP